MMALHEQRGVALLVVLWACTLLAILLGGYAALSRTEAMQARYQFAQTQAHYAAEAGLNRAIYSLQAPDQRAIANRTAHKLMPHVAFQRRKVGQVPRIGEGVERHHRLVIG